jgi:hypothetical protein
MISYDENPLDVPQSDLADACIVMDALGKDAK